MENPKEFTQNIKTNKKLQQIFKMQDHTNINYICISAMKDPKVKLRK